MTTQRSTFAKLQRERAKKAKAAAKREKRHDRGGDTDEIDLEGEAATPEAPRDEYRTEDTIQQLDDLHKRFEAGTISYERFEETKLELFSRLSID
ncbi:MAG: hypothetical protein QOH10_370 [Actinomycetota bacterium]|nr:hypothetical protein [Actinomycetota bacterium]